MIPYITVNISTYSMMAVIGILVTIIYLLKRSIKSDVFPKKVKTLKKLILLTGLCCIVGSRILFVITYFLNNNFNVSFSDAINVIAFGGFVFYGGLFGAISGTMLFCNIENYNPKTILNYLMPAFPLFHAFGRIGCFLGGCCYGFKFAEPIIIGRVAFNYFPIQLVEVIFEFGMFLLLNKLSSINNEFDLTTIYLSIYSSYRFIAEFFRGDAERGMLLFLSVSQWISLIILIILICKKVHRITIAIRSASL